MTNKEFNQIVEESTEKIKSILTSKSKEYNADDKDRLDHFKAGAKLLKCSTTDCIKDYMTKHIVSIYQMLESPNSYSVAKFDEKLFDAINYFIILRASLIEELSENKKEIKSKRQILLENKKEGK